MDSVTGMRAAINSAEDTTVEFRNVVVQLPRLTSSLNKAKRNVAHVLDNLIIEFQTANGLANEVEAMITRATEEHAKKDGI